MMGRTAMTMTMMKLSLLILPMVTCQIHKDSDKVLVLGPCDFSRGKLEVLDFPDMTLSSCQIDHLYPDIMMYETLAVTDPLTGSLKLCGGYSFATFIPTSACYIYNPLEGWIETPPLTIERYDSAVAQIGDSTWIIAGGN